MASGDPIRGPAWRVGALSILGQLLSQGSNGLAAIGRIPILVVALSASGYGSFTLVQALVPWLLVVPLGIRQSLRAMGAQALQGSPEEADLVRQAHVATLRRVVVTTTVASMVGSVLLGLAWPHLASPGGGRPEAIVVLVSSALICISGFAGTAHAGWLEATDRIGLVNVMGALTGVAGLALTFVLWKVHAPFGLFAVAGVAAAVAPAWCALFWDRPARSDSSPSPQLLAAVRVNSMRFLYGATATLLAAGLAPFVVGSLLGTESAASYAVAARLAVIVTLVPTSLTPLLWNRHARLRTATDGSAHGLRRLLYTSAGVGVALAAVFAVAGPFMGHLLGASDVPAPRALYVAFALHGVVQFVQAPLTAALSGPRGAQFMSRSTAVASLAAVLVSVPATVVLGVSGPVWAIVTAFGAVSCVWIRRVRREGGYLTDLHLQPEAPQS